MSIINHSQEIKSNPNIKHDEVQSKNTLLIDTNNDMDQQYINEINDDDLFNINLEFPNSQFNNEITSDQLPRNALGHKLSNQYNIL